MTDWYERTIKALQLNGKGERTQECYARAVRMLSELYEKNPDLVSEEELQGRTYESREEPVILEKSMNPTGGANDIRSVGRSQPLDTVRSLAVF